MSEYYHVVPWYNSEEWHNVYENIYSSTTSSLTRKQHAHKSLLMWKARCPSLPSGVESTLTLLEVYIQDVTSRFDMTNHHLLRLAYSSAVMRFVNHMLDSETVKGVSLFQAAKNLGIPDWIVDLRHDTAHNNKLPSIELLREATLIGLEWLKTHYWDKHREYIRDYVSGYKESTLSNDKIDTLMNLCISLSFCICTKITDLNDIPQPLMRESILNDARELLGNKINLPKFNTISTLINLINVHSQKLLKNKNYSAYINEILLGDDSVILSLEVLKYLSHKEFKNKRLNRHYVQCFQTLFTILHSNDLLTNFILELIKVTQTSENSDKATLAALWVSEILTALRKIKIFYEKMKMLSGDAEYLHTMDLEQLKLLYYHWYPNEKMRCLLLDLHKPVPDEFMNIDFIQPIISTYNSYLTYFIRDLLRLVEPQLAKPVFERICELARLISSPNKFPVIDSKIYTIEDIKTKTKSEMEQNAMDIEYDSDSDCVEIVDKSNEKNIEESTDEISLEIHKSSIWKLASKKHNWAECPIGNLPWQQKTVKNVKTN